jgi:hypothetical protein
MRAIAAVTTGGASEFLRKKPFQPGGGTDLKGAILSSAAGPYGSGILAGTGQKIDTASQSTPVSPLAKPGMTPAEMQQLANNAANQRRSDYANLGRSSTILTGPGGLGGTGSGTAKTLLGM